LLLIPLFLRLRALRLAGQCSDLPSYFLEGANVRVLIRISAQAVPHLSPTANRRAGLNPDHRACAPTLPDLPSLPPPQRSPYRLCATHIAIHRSQFSPPESSTRREARLPRWEPSQRVPPRVVFPDHRPDRGPPSR
jgi:hypothetical protein